MCIHVSALFPWLPALSLRAAEAPYRRGVPQEVEREDLRHPMVAELVQSRLEVVENDAVCEALEYERKLPERVDDADWNHRSHGQNVDDDEDDAEGHAEE